MSEYALHAVFTDPDQAKATLLNSRLINAEDLRARLEYRKSEGIFIWKKSRRSGVAGRVAGYITPKGYVYINIDCRLYFAHRLAWLYEFGVWPAGQIDHIDGNRQNNRIQNLRVVEPSINSENRRFARRGKKDDCPLGVTKEISRGVEKYRARITTAGKTKTVGLFSSAEEAHSAYLLEKRSIHKGCTI